MSDGDPHAAGHVPLTLGTVEVDGAVHLVVAGEVDMATRDLLGAALRALVGEGARSLVIDLTDVAFMDSAGLAVLAEQLGAGIQITLLRPQRPVLRALEISGLTERLTVVDPQRTSSPTPD
jgi:anti-sigma B factor antagonist